MNLKLCRKPPAPLPVSGIGPPVSKTSSTTSLNSGSDLPSSKPGSPPPVPPKPKSNSSTSDLTQNSTYMNKAELLEELDTLNKNSTRVKTPDGTSTTNRRSGQKEYFVPPGVKDSQRNSTASN